jgi:hypothetical protein
MNTARVPPDARYETRVCPASVCRGSIDAGAGRYEMRQIDRLYDWLLEGPAPECDRILGAALTHAEPVWAEQMIRLLLKRGEDASWAALIGHYDRLSPEVCALLHQQRERMQAGVALALKSSSRATRANALRALGQQPLVQMAYLLPYALRDSSREVRELAGRTLHQMGESFLGQPVPSEGADRAVRQAYEEQRSQLNLALAEALRAFDLHCRVEVLEVGLWFARDLGELLWDRLAPHRSHAGTVVAQQIFDWSGPRLAYFLLTALKRPSWRRTATRVLQRWRTVPHVAALLQEQDLLRDPGIRRRLGGIHSPHWFTETDEGLADLEPHLRPRAPQLVCHAGYTESEKLALLSRWLQAPDAELHSAAVHALAQIDTPEARALLGEVAESDSSLARLAGWCARAFDTDAVKEALERELPNVAEKDLKLAGGLPEQEGFEVDCDMLWQACRRVSPDARGELIAMLRENARVWQGALRSYLRSSDAYDRVLALQVISTGELAQWFRGEVETLLDDPIKGIRELVGRLLEALPNTPPTFDGWAPVAGGQSSQRGPQALDEARSELRAMLARLGTGEHGAMDAELVGRIRDLLRVVYADQNVPASVTAGGEEG